MKTLYILAGANGSGKSTIAKELLPAENISYVNADDIAQELCPEDMQKVRIQAGKEVHFRIAELVRSGKSFALESTLSGVGHLKTIALAKQNGYKVVIVYTFVDAVETCLERIKARVRNGGHPVPEEDVKRRFLRSRENFWHKYRWESDQWMIYFNGGNDITLVAQQQGAEVEIISENLYTIFKRDL